MNSPAFRLLSLPRDGLLHLKKLGSLGDLLQPVEFVELKPLTGHPLVSEVAVQFGLELRVSSLPAPPHLQWKWRCGL
ncbi:hypothetical protein PU648_57555 (plasmid) [Streptomyces mirabilis]|uniref:Uncharacterized protein n=1 Tax=Streptomyces mirabilis TaxID=68239 RepID=A0ABU3V659_9ACTN|nr:hypothetical protein [Streptomyces mirabilis]MDU9001658.1 hypothetical protein [Streptomyces mirabilis]